MTAATYTIPTLLWVLPLIAVAFPAWVWLWNRTVLPAMRWFLVRRARRHLINRAGRTPESADQLIAQWRAEGWPDVSRRCVQRSPLPGIPTTLTEETDRG